MDNKKSMKSRRLVHAVRNSPQTLNAQWGMQRVAASGSRYVT